MLLLVCNGNAVESRRCGSRVCEWTHIWKKSKVNTPHIRLCCSSDNQRKTIFVPELANLSHSKLSPDFFAKVHKWRSTLGFIATQNHTWISPIFTKLWLLNKLDMCFYRSFEKRYIRKVCRVYALQTLGTHLVKPTQTKLPINAMIGLSSSHAQRFDMEAIKVF